MEKPEIEVPKGEGKTAKKKKQVKPVPQEMYGPCCGVALEREKTNGITEGVRERSRAVCIKDGCDWQGKPKRKRAGAIRDARSHTHK